MRWNYAKDMTRKHASRMTNWFLSLSEKGWSSSPYIPFATSGISIWTKYVFHPIVFVSYKNVPSCSGGCFRKKGYPQIIHFNKVFHYKPSILGYHYFWKHPGASGEEKCLVKRVSSFLLWWRHCEVPADPSCARPTWDYERIQTFETCGIFL